MVVFALHAEEVVVVIVVVVVVVIVVVVVVVVVHAPWDDSFVTSVVEYDELKTGDVERAQVDASTSV